MTDHIHEANPDFVAFCTDIDENMLPAIAEHLNSTLRRYAKIRLSDSSILQEEALDKFFKLCSSHTGRVIPIGTTDKPNTDLVKSWTKGPRPAYAYVLEVYYTLHCVQWGKSVAEKIDRKIFGKTFRNDFGYPVPGGYEREIVNATPSDISRVESKFDEFVAWAKSNGMFAKAAEEGINEEAVRAIVEGLGGFGIEKDDLLEYLSCWIADVKSEQSRRTNEGRSFEDARALALQRLTAGHHKNAVEPLMDLLRTEREESDHRRKLILDEVVRIETLSLNVDSLVEKLHAASFQLTSSKRSARLSFLREHADSLHNVGHRTGDNFALLAAIEVYKSILDEHRQDLMPLDWAKTQNALGTALGSLGDCHHNDGIKC